MAGARLVFVLSREPQWRWQRSDGRRNGTGTWAFFSTLRPHGVLRCRRPPSMYSYFWCAPGHKHRATPSDGCLSALPADAAPAISSLRACEAFAATRLLYSATLLSCHPATCEAFLNGREAFGQTYHRS